MNLRMSLGVIGAVFAIPLLSACTPVDPGLERSLAIEFEGNSQGGATGGGVGIAPRRGVATDPSWDPGERIPNTNPRILTNNVYGPGRSSDIYGRVVYHDPGLIIEQTAVGTGDFRDQYGRPVRCYGSGMGTFCR